MNGPKVLADFVIGVVILSALFLCSFLFGPELTIIFLAITAALIVQSLTPCSTQKRASSRKVLPRSRSLPQKLAPTVVPNLPESPPLHRKKRYRPSEGINQLLNFEEDQ